MMELFYGVDFFNIFSIPGLEAVNIPLQAPINGIEAVNIPLQAPINGNESEVGSSGWNIANIVYNSLENIYNFIWPGAVIDSSITSSSTTSSSEEVIEEVIEAEVGSSDWSIVNIIYNSLENIYNFIWPGTVIEEVMTRPEGVIEETVAELLQRNSDHLGETVAELLQRNSDHFRDIIFAPAGTVNEEVIGDVSENGEEVMTRSDHEEVNELVKLHVIDYSMTHTLNSPITSSSSEEIMTRPEGVIGGTVAEFLQRNYDNLGDIITEANELDIEPGNEPLNDEEVNEQLNDEELNMTEFTLPRSPCSPLFLKMKINPDGGYFVPSNGFINSEQMWTSIIYEYLGKGEKGVLSDIVEGITVNDIKNYLLEEAPANLKVKHANLVSDSRNIEFKLPQVYQLNEELEHYYKIQVDLWLTDLQLLGSENSWSSNEASYSILSREDHFVYCGGSKEDVNGAYKDFCKFKAKEVSASEVALEAFKAVREAEDLLQGKLDSESELLTNLRNAEINLVVARLEYFINCFKNSKITTAFMSGK